MEKLFGAWKFFLEDILGRIAAAAFLLAVFIAIVEVFRRYVLGRSWLWQQDMVVMLTLSSVFLYFGIAQLQRRHIAMLVLQSLLARRGPIGKALRKAIDIASLMAMLGIMLILCYWGVREANTLFTFGTRSPSLTLPLWPFVALLTLGFILTSVTIWFQIVRGALGAEDWSLNELDEVVELVEQDPSLIRRDDTSITSPGKERTAPPGGDRT